MEATLDTLDTLLGDWKGTVSTWLRPDELAGTSDISGSFKSLLGGRSVLYEYTSTVGEHRSDGLAVLGKDASDDLLRMTWVDTFHTGSNLMNFEEERSDELALRGNYTAGGQSWGWRILFKPSGSDDLLIQHFNLLPGGEEALAVEIKYRKA